MERPVSRGAVLMLHAFPCSGRMWAAQADALSGAGWDVVVPDLPGFGGSDLLDAEPDLDAVASVLLRELDAQGLGRVAVVGLSLGGYLAMTLARVAPERLTAVVLCDTKGTADTPAAVENRHRLAQAALDDPANCGRILRQSVLPGLLGATTFAERPEVVTLVEGWLDAARPASVAWYQRAMAARPDSLDVLGALRVPGLVLWGDEDAISPADEQHAMLDALTDGRSAVIPTSGHLAAVECPDAVSAALIDFLASR